MNEVKNTTKEEEFGKTMGDLFANIFLKPICAAIVTGTVGKDKTQEEKNKLFSDVMSA